MPSFKQPTLGIQTMPHGKSVTAPSRTAPLRAPQSPAAQIVTSSPHPPANRTTTPKLPIAKGVDRERWDSVILLFVRSKSKVVRMPMTLSSRPPHVNLTARYLCAPHLTARSVPIHHRRWQARAIDDATVDCASPLDRSQPCLPFRHPE